MKLLSWILALLFTSILAVGLTNQIKASEPQRILKVGTYNNAPKIYTDNYDNVTGIFPDILSYIAAKENWKIEYVPGLWDTDLSRLQKGQINIMPDVAVSPDRQKLFDFNNETVLISWAVVYVNKNSSINIASDLEGKKIAILKSSIYNDSDGGISSVLKKEGVSVTMEPVENYRATLDLLEIGRVDAAVVSHVYALANEKNYKNIRPTSIYLKPSELRFALTKGAKDNSYIIGKLDYWTSKLKSGEDGYLKTILEKYGLEDLGSEFGWDKEPEMQKQSFPFGTGIVSLSLLILATAAFFSIKYLTGR